MTPRRTNPSTPSARLESAHYPPDAVAAGILSAATHRKRDVYVGGQAEQLVMVSNVAPKLVYR